MSTTPFQGNIFIVGLAGPSGSGKSTVAKRVASRLNGHVISMEIYSMEMNHLPLEERAKMDYDAPHAIDVELLDRHIRDYASGKAIEAPIYDFTKHLRVSDQREHIPAKSLLIVEGILVCTLRNCARSTTYPSIWKPPMRFVSTAERSGTSPSVSALWTSSCGNIKIRCYRRRGSTCCPASATPISSCKATRSCQVEKSVYDAIVDSHVLAGTPSNPKLSQRICVDSATLP
jgi:hypothetical protein